MKKIKIFSVSTLIRGKKSSGSEDSSGYKHWKKIPNNCSSESMN